VTSGIKKPKGAKIGLRQANRLCQLGEHERLAFIAEGLPSILRSAERAWEAAKLLRNSNGRESAILEGVATEEAAKILILVDAVRCPAKLVPSKMNRFVDRFYDHLARLIYAEAVSWKPTNLAELREYVDRERRDHYLEGRAGEYIMPNSTIYRRESRLYVDVEAYQDDTLTWSEPRDPHVGLPFLSFVPPALRVAAAMEQVGMFTPNGLKAVSEIWGSLEYRDREDHHDGAKLTEQMLKRLHAEGLMLDTAQDDDVGVLYRDWQIPMYNLDFSLIQVPLEELEAEQERELWSMR
jgi:AbiV family abortive infection protein